MDERFAPYLEAASEDGAWTTDLTVREVSDLVIARYREAVVTLGRASGIPGRLPDERDRRADRKVTRIAANWIDGRLRTWVTTTGAAELPWKRTSWDPVNNREFVEVVMAEADPGEASTLDVADYLGRLHDWVVRTGVGVVAARFRGQDKSYNGAAWRLVADAEAIERLGEKVAALYSSGRSKSESEAKAAVAAKLGLEEDDLIWDEL